MVGPIQSGPSPEPIRESASPNEQQKIFEMQWETGLIGAYVSVTEKNEGDIPTQLEGIKLALEKGEKSPDQLIETVNQIISQVNQQMDSASAPLPSFVFTAGGNSTKALTQYAISFEKFVNAAAETGKLSWDVEQNVFSQTTALIEQIGTLPPDEVVNRLNSAIVTANRAMKLPFHLELLGKI